MRLIDADKYRESLVRSWKGCQKWNKQPGLEETQLRAEQAEITFWECILRLDKQPTVEAQPVRHARLVNASPYGECSCCGEPIDSRDRFRYCPQCGARLIGEGEQNEI